MATKKNLVGQKYNWLIVLEQDMEKYAEKHEVFWKCRCDCGNFKSVRTYDLTHGKTKSCGCLRNKKVREAIGNKLEGQRFGKLTVLKQVDSILENSGQLRTAWLCRCDCGEEVVVKTINLKSGDTKSCGCWNLENLSNRKKNLIGIRFGKLVPFEANLEKMQQRKDYDTRAYWKCKCDCGNICTVSSNNLLQGHTTSCGCEKSQGENYISIALNKGNWKYKREYEFSDLKGDKFPLRFDFAVFENHQILFLIEFQGAQHYYPNEFFGGIEKFIKQQDYDKRKIDYCHNNHIPLVIIPYYDKGKITLDYIKEKYHEAKEILGYKEA